LGAIALVLGILISVFIMPLVFLGFMEGLSQEVITGY
jgi:preprotein translocase subunit SecD